MIITEIRVQKNRKNRYNLYTEDGFALSLSDETIVKNSIKTGSVISDELFEKLKEEDTFKFAKEVSFKYVTYCPRTEKQLLKKLASCGIDEQTANRAAKIMKEYGYINDRTFAYEYSKSYLKKYSAKIVVSKLIAEGVDERIAKEVVDKQDQKSGLKLLIEKYEKKYSSLEPKMKKKKICESLMRRGFGWSQIEDAMHCDMWED